MDARISDSVKAAVNGILRQDVPPPLNRAELKAYFEADETEPSLVSALLNTFFPDPDPRSKVLQGQRFDTAVLPRNPRVLSISTPVPDVTCGYPVDESVTQKLEGPSYKFQGTSLDSILAPSGTARRPYFVVEVKSSRNGDVFTTTNQAAGAGSACVKAARDMARCADVETGAEDTMA